MTYALTIKQPYAQLITLEEKRFETRPRRINYRGDVVITASAKPVRIESMSIYERGYFYVALDKHGVDADKLPLGCGICIAQIYDCRPSPEVAQFIDTPEWVFGDFSEGRWAIELRNIRVFPEPIPCKGNLGLWKWKLPLPPTN